MGRVSRIESNGRAIEREFQNREGRGAAGGHPMGGTAPETQSDVPRGAGTERCGGWAAPRRAEELRRRGGTDLSGARACAPEGRRVASRQGDAQPWHREGKEGRPAGRDARSAKAATHGRPEAGEGTQTLAGGSHEEGTNRVNGERGRDAAGLRGGGVERAGGTYGTAAEEAQTSAARRGRARASSRRRRASGLGARVADCGSEDGDDATAAGGTGRHAHPGAQPACQAKRPSCLGRACRRVVRVASAARARPGRENVESGVP